MGDTLNSGVASSSGGGYTPSVTVYCEQADVASIWSQYGVDARIDDNEDEDVIDVPEAGTLLRTIERATVEVNVYLLQRYSVAVCAASTWVKWCTAVFACVYLAERRGNTIPKAMQTDYDRYHKMLEAIAAGTQPLMGDDGPAAPAFDSTPIVSNVTVDRRMHRSKIRRTDANSTQATPTPPRKQKRAFGYYPYD